MYSLEGKLVKTVNQTKQPIGLYTEIGLFLFISGHLHSQNSNSKPQNFNRKNYQVMRKKLLLILLTISSLNIYTQDNNLDYNISSRHLSPQAYEFARYGNTPVKHFVGELDLSIPLYTYQDKDFIIPITLQYNGTGFMPNKNEGLIGLDWSLNVGGAITRQVNGAPDETIGVPFLDQDALGVLLASRIGVYNYDISFNNKIENTDLQDKTVLGSGEIINSLNSIPAHYNPAVSASQMQGGDLAPDNFNFYMPGHAGKFNIGWDGKAQLGGDKPYQIVFSDNFTNGSDSKNITITSPDGYKYIFGSNDNATETSTSFPDRKNLLNQWTVTTAWNLSKIIAPNKRSVEFIYKDVAKRVSGAGNGGILPDIRLFI